MTSSPDVTATFCATLADEWVRGGVSDVVVCPGSRSTPLALAVAAEPRLRVHVHHDERSGGFMALGIGLASGRPAVVVTTSGTAVTELHPAVVEAHQAHVPLIVVTADRPPELQDVGAPQTIDQTHVFGRSIRYFAEPGVPDDIVAHTWRSLAARSVAQAAGPVPGPVHLNLAFREPLIGEAGKLPPGREGGGPAVQVHYADTDCLGGQGHEAIRDIVAVRRGVIVVGALDIQINPIVHRFAAAVGWPLIADPRSGVAAPGRTTVAAADAILRNQATADRLQPDAIIRIGEPPTSRVLNAWLDGSAARQLLVHPDGAWIDPAHRLQGIVPVGLFASMGDQHADPADPAWLAAWADAEASAQRSIDEVLAAHLEPTEPGIARSVLAALPDGSTLVTSSSMPVRDVEWYGAPREGVRVLANRGANGIDGVTSTAVGVALGSDRPTALLIGDVAFLHDTNGLLGLARRNVDLTIIAVDNDGGGIFSFLPQRSALSTERFEQLFGTPHGVDLAGLAKAHGIAVVEPATAAEVGPAVAAAMAGGGVHVVLVRTERDANVAMHEEIHARVAAALPEMG